MLLSEGTRADCIEGFPFLRLWSMLGATRVLAAIFGVRRKRYLEIVDQGKLPAHTILTLLWNFTLLWKKPLKSNAGFLAGQAWNHRKCSNSTARLGK